jgi:predicted dehydrogenase
MPNHNALTVGILGAGQIAQQSHLPVLLALPECKVVWIADANHELSRSVGRAAGVATPSLEEGPHALPEADVVLLAIPYGARARYFEHLRNRGQRAIYVEKPFARSLAEHEQLCAGYSDSSVAVGFIRRVQRSTTIVSRLIRERVFGRVRSVSFGYGGIGGGSYGVKYYANARLAGGGAFFEVGVHGVDAVLHTLGAHPVSPLKLETVFDSGLDLHVSGTWRCEMPSQPESIDFDFTVTRLQDVANEITISFDHHRLFWPFMGDGEVEVMTIGGGSRYRLGLTDLTAPRSSYELQAAYWSAFLGGLAEPHANQTSAATTKGVTRIVEHVYAQMPAEVNER